MRTLAYPPYRPLRRAALRASTALLLCLLATACAAPLGPGGATPPPSPPAAAFIPLTAPAAPFEALARRPGPWLLYHSTGISQTLKLAGIATGERLALTGLCGPDPSLQAQDGQWSPDGRMLVIFCFKPNTTGPSGQGQATYLWDVRASRSMRVDQGPPGTGPLVFMSWSPDSRYLLLYQITDVVTPTPTTATLWYTLDVTTGTRTLLPEPLANSTAAWAPDSRTVAIAGQTLESPPAPRLALVGVDGPASHPVEAIAHLEVATDSLGCCVWAPDGRTIYLTASSISPHDHGTPVRVDVATGAVTAPGPRVHAVSPDGQSLLALYANEWPPTLSRYEWQVTDRNGKQLPVQFGGLGFWLPDGRILASECEVAVSPQGSAYDVGRVSVIALDGRRDVLVEHLEPCVRALPSTDGSLVAVSYPDHIDVLDLGGKVVASMNGYFPGWELRGGYWFPGARP